MREEVGVITRGPEVATLGKRMFEGKPIIFEVTHERFSHIGVHVVSATRMDTEGKTWEFIGALLHAREHTGVLPSSVKVLWDVAQSRGMVTFQYR